MSMTAVMTAVTCVLAPLSIPIGPVPISFNSVAIYLSLYLLGWKRGTVSYIVYVCIGMMGMPVFSGCSGGVGKLFGATGGYIIGFIPAALLVGLAIDGSGRRVVYFAAMLVGTAVCYAFGTAWFCVVMGSDIAAALGVCVFPFIPGDLAKILAVLAVGPLLQTRLRREGLLKIK